MTFTIDGSTVATVTLVNGKATYATSTLAKGSHTIAAVYSGSVNYKGSASSTLNQTVK